MPLLEPSSSADNTAVRSRLFKRKNTDRDDAAKLKRVEAVQVSIYLLASLFSWGFPPGKKVETGEFHDDRATIASSRPCGGTGEEEEIFVPRPGQFEP